MNQALSWVKASWIPLIIGILVGRFLLARFI